MECADGARAVYAEYHGKEVLFHVATLLPFTDDDSQQVLYNPLVALTERSVDVL
jgi:hypothetical protein